MNAEEGGTRPPQRRRSISSLELSKGPTVPWFNEIEGSDRQRLVAVLQAGNIDSPRNAVRVAILQEFRDSVESAED